MGDDSPSGGACWDCGRRYGDEYGFPDLVVPHDIWNNHISPTGNEGGLLCPSCICRRAHAAGVQCRAEFRSGPFAVMNSGPVSADHYTVMEEARAREAKERGRE